MGILLPMLILGGAGLVAAVILFIVAKRFAVYEDERIAQVEALLPGANCGACGRKGCHDFAVACCEAKSLDGLRCPGAGDAGMAAIAELLGFTASAGPKVRAFVRCNGTCDNRLVNRNVMAAQSCSFAKTLAVPENYCVWGCLGCGDCVSACRFGALTMDAATGMPVVDLEKCTGCEACSKACPQGIIAMRTVDDERPTVWVACSNKAKGAASRKMCAVSCIGCGKCVRSCPEKAIELADNVATINGDLCVGCGKCVEGCPTHAIHSIPEIEN
ncbi:MAG: RnfABCDGE type electron transport complex subunit B [Muribaculaceae bacterium]|nr:RnfABCDGE type electron transport complex subunit B [Muribaculaceae bacterium]